MLCEELNDINFYNYDINLEKLQTNQLFVDATYKDEIRFESLHIYILTITFQL